MQIETYLEASTQQSAFRVLSALEDGDTGLQGALMDEFDLARGLLAQALKVELPLAGYLEGSHAEATHLILSQAIGQLGDEVRKHAAQDESAAQQLLLRRDCFAFLAHQAGLAAGTEPDAVNDAYRDTVAKWIATCDARRQPGPPSGPQSH